jgi:hypothetical protein
LENSNGTFTFARDGEGTWTMEGLTADETLNEAQVNAVLRRGAFVTMVEPLGKTEQSTYGLDEPSAVVTLETTEKTVTLRVGARDPEDNSYVVISSESPYYVRIAEFGARELVEFTRDDFLQTEPTPTVEGEAGGS